MLNPDFRDILSCLKDEAVEFIIVGAYALAAHGYLRATGDVDIWINHTPENARRALQALARFGAPISDLTERDLTLPDMIVQIGVEPCRIDLLTSIDGVDFDAAWESKTSVRVDDLEIYVLSKAALLTNKLAANRDKDQGDIAWLMKNQDTDA